MKKIELEKYLSIVRNAYRANPERSLLAIGFLILALIYLFSRTADHTTVVYKNDAPNQVTESRVISSSTDGIYERKNRALTGRIRSLEEKLDFLIKAQEESRNTSESQTGAPDQSNNSEIPTSSTSSLSLNSPNQAPKNTATNSFPPTLPHTSMPSSSPKGIKLFSSDRKVRSSTRRTKSSTGPSMISFPVKRTKDKKLDTVKLPLGSYVKAKLLTGVEAVEGKPLPLLAQLDHAFVGPNKTKIDLTGCFSIIKSAGNLSSERAEGQAVKLSCVSHSGRSFERDINGFMIDNKDNSFGVIGVVNSKQDRVAAQAFLASIVEGISESVKQGQVTQSQNALGGTSSTVTGDQTKHLLASGSSNAAHTVTQWYLRHAENLMPTINIGSGSDVWIIMQEGTELPNWFFKGKTAKKAQHSFLSEITK